MGTAGKAAGKAMNGRTAVQRRDRESAARLEVRLLGSFEVGYRGRPPLCFESRRTRALLAYLLCHPDRAVPRESLGALLWPEADAATSRHNLRQAFYNLRQTLTPPAGGSSPLTTRHDSLAFTPPPGAWIDLAVFAEALRRGHDPRGGIEPRALARAVEVYGGDFLAGFWFPGGTIFEEWLLAEQERWREAAVAALTDLVEHYLRHGGYGAGIEHARRLQTIEPLAEEPHRQLMRLYALSGRRGRAVAVYESLRCLLATELEVAPMPETTQLYRRILAQELPSPAIARETPGARGYRSAGSGAAAR
jgi:DNA-binding SARP family transcriptional activator